MSTMWDEKETLEQKSARQQRDLYLEMKRLENPDYALIPIQELRSALNMEGKCGTSAAEVADSLAKSSKAAIKSGTKLPYECMTQQDETLDMLFLGVMKGSIVLWESGSSINWIARMDGYPSRKHAMEAATATYKATQRWNDVLKGRLKFRYVTKFDDACFELCYGGDRGGVMASAFFPDQYENSLNKLKVFAGLYKKPQRPYMMNTMLHELGHVLGLRHEHSHSGVPGWLPAEDQANGAESVMWGVRNPRSVMAYYAGQNIQPSDIDAITEAYDDLTDGKVLTGTGRFGKITKTVRRVEPNN